MNATDTVSTGSTRYTVRLRHRIRVSVIERGGWADLLEWAACAGNGWRAVRWWEGREPEDGDEKLLDVLSSDL